MVKLEADLEELVVGLAGWVESVEGWFSGSHWDIFCAAALLKKFWIFLLCFSFLDACYSHIPLFDKEKSFLRNLQLALVSLVDFDTLEENLVSFNEALAKEVFLILGIILISSLKHRSV